MAIGRRPITEPTVAVESPAADDAGCPTSTGVVVAGIDSRPVCRTRQDEAGRLCRFGAGGSAAELPEEVEPPAGDAADAYRAGVGDASADHLPVGRSGC